jgi:hypothetical protein
VLRRQGRRWRQRRWEWDCFVPFQQTVVMSSAGGRRRWIYSLLHPGRSCGVESGIDELMMDVRIDLSSAVVDFLRGTRHNLCLHHMSAQRQRSRDGKSHYG